MSEPEAPLSPAQLAVVKEVVKQHEGIAALSAIAKLLVDAVNDYQAFSAVPHKTTVAAVTYFGNLLPDILAAAAHASSIPAEINDLDPDEVQQIVAIVANGLRLQGDQAKRVLQAFVKVLTDVLNNADDIKELYLAIVNAPRSAQPA